MDNSPILYSTPRTIRADELSILMRYMKTLSSLLHSFGLIMIWLVFAMHAYVPAQLHVQGGQY
jgi:hypothetical protein